MVFSTNNDVLIWNIRWFLSSDHVKKKAKQHACSCNFVANWRCLVCHWIKAFTAGSVFSEGPGGWRWQEDGKPHVCYDDADFSSEGCPRIPTCAGCTQLFSVSSGWQNLCCYTHDHLYLWYPIWFQTHQSDIAAALLYQMVLFTFCGKYQIISLKAAKQWKVFPAHGSKLISQDCGRVRSVNCLPKYEFNSKPVCKRLFNFPGLDWSKSPQ